MLRRLARLVAAAGIVCVVPAQALGLGEIDVRSKLNQRFSASIPVFEASAQDLESLQVVLASAADFERAGIERADYLTSLSLQLKSGPGGTSVLVSSPQIDHEPFLNFLVEAHWQGGRLQREYTVLLDPPNLQADDVASSAANSVAAPAVAPASALSAETTAAPLSLASQADSAPLEPAPVAAPEEPAPTAHKPHRITPAAAANQKVEIDDSATGGTASAKSYGPVDPQETLWSIANKLKPEAASVDQILLALYQNNPDAFDRGRFNGLLRGAVLKVPADAQIEAVSPEVAHARVMRLRGGAQLAADNGEAAAADAAPARAAKTQSSVGKKDKAASAPADASTPATAALAAAAAPSPSATAISPDISSASTSTAAPVSAVTAPKTELSPSAPVTAGDSGKAGAAPVAPSPESPANATLPATAPASTTAGTTAPPPAEPATQASTTADNRPSANEPVPAPAAPDSTAASTTANGAVPATNANPTAPAVAPAAADSSISLIDDFKLPLLAILVVLLIGFLGWRMTREKNSPPEFSPAPRLPVAPTPTAPKPVAGRLTPHSEAITALDLEPRRAPGATADSVKPAIAAQLYADDAAPAKTPLLIDAKPARGAAVAADPDIATQLKAQTVPVNLDVNDPLSEADFHLAYGLYDEAATLLRRGLEKEPTRKDLRVKLAETYYGAGKVAEFQQTALALRGQISAADWDKLAEMGRKIAPDIGAFKAPGTAAIVPPRPAPPAAVPPSSLMSAPAPPPAPPAAFDLNLGAARATPASAPPPAAVDRTIDFDLDTALTKPYDKPTPAIADLNLHQFDNGIDFEPDTGLLQAPQKTVSAPPFELGSFDAPAHHTLADAPAPLRLDDLDFASPAPIDHAELGAENEISTKLDLARAYADMGDNEAASGLLREVILAGSAAQKQEAEGLAKRLLSA